MNHNPAGIDLDAQAGAPRHNLLVGMIEAARKMAVHEIISILEQEAARLGTSRLHLEHGYARYAGPGSDEELCSVDYFRRHRSTWFTGNTDCPMVRELPLDDALPLLMLLETQELYTTSFNERNGF